jgi:hypothetical protein
MMRVVVRQQRDYSGCFSPTEDGYWIRYPWFNHGMPCKNTVWCAASSLSTDVPYYYSTAWKRCTHRLLPPCPCRVAAACLAHPLLMHTEPSMCHRSPFPLLPLCTHPPTHTDLLFYCLLLVAWHSLILLPLSTHAPPPPLTGAACEPGAAAGVHHRWCQLPGRGGPQVGGGGRCGEQGRTRLHGEAGGGYVCSESIVGEWGGGLGRGG